MQLFEYERVLTFIACLRPRFSKDGGQWFFLYGENLQEGIAGFGDTPWDATQDFYRNFTSERIKTE